MRLNCLLMPIACLLLSCKNNTDLKPTSTLSKELGNLYFSKVQYSKATAVDYSNDFNLHEDAYLNIHFSMDTPLLESLRALAPNLSEEELLGKGNFQFSYIVDGNLIYTENLNLGAGSKTFKTKELDIMIPLVNPEQMDWWGRSMWKRFMKIHGGQDVLNTGNHSLSIEVKAYLNENTLKVSPLLAQGTIAVEVPKIKIDESLVPVQKIQANSGWEISQDNFDSTKIEALNRKIAEGKFEDVNGIVVLKKGKLLIEEYFNGEARGTLHDPRSVGKTIASTMMGIAIEENYITSEDVPLKDFYDLKSFKNYSAQKDAVTLKSLLTMSSGFSGDDDDTDNPGNENYMYPTDDWVKFALDQPMHPNKVMGKDYAYFTAGVVVLGDIIHKSVPDGLEVYADKKLFKPLGITDYKWPYTPQKVGSTAGGIRLRALDFAKYGQLYKNKGLWNGKQILTKLWVEKSLSKQVSQAYSGIADGYYGYLFWNKIYSVNGKDYEVSFCTGNGGNKIFIFKNIPVVVVITASAYNNPAGHFNADTMITDYILPAILVRE